MAIVSLFQNFNKVIENKSLEEILKEIKSGIYRKQIITLGKLHTEGKAAEFEKLKKSLPAFTPSGLFEGGRKLEYLKQYSNFVILDFDKLSLVQLDKAKGTITKDAFTFACFISPSGSGLKILVKVSGGIDDHQTSFQKLKQYFEKLLDLPIDKSGKDITRLCFVSYDPELFLNTNAKSFELQQKFIASELQTMYEDAIHFTEKKESYTTGNRNNFVFQLANNLNRKGISISDAQSLILRDYNFNESEVTTTIKSAYNNFNQHASKIHSPTENRIKGEGTTKRRFTANKFVLAQEFIKKHFVIRRNIVTQEYECRDINKAEFECMNENNIFIKMQMSGLNMSLE